MGDRIGIIAWLILGLIAGFVASKLMGGGGYGILGGFIFGLVTGLSDGVNNLDIGSIIVAIIGACMLIAILRAVSGNRARV